MNWNEFTSAVNDAEFVVRRGDEAVARLGRLLPGRLHLLSPYVLSLLKRELRDYNIHTEQWRD